jgi:uncharacterized protein (DUF302 family)
MPRMVFTCTCNRLTGLLLPCNVVVREDAGGAVTVSFMHPVAVPQLTQPPGRWRS